MGIRMNTSVNEIYAALQKRGVDVDPVVLPSGATMLLFDYAGKVRSISGTSPDLTSATGRTIANNKYATYTYAQRLGMPVPMTESYVDATQAEAFLGSYGRIVVKPLDGAHGNGVTTGIVTTEQLRSAVDKARTVSDNVILQQQVTGSDLRILVIGGQLAAVAERVPASVTGDGERSVKALIEHENASNPLRGLNYEKPLNRIDVDVASQFLGEAGMSDVPAKNENVIVVGTANIGTGGHAVNRTGLVPAAMVEQAVMLAESIGVYTCGVDFLYDADRQEWHLIEVNSSPSFGLHLWPTEGDPIDVTELFVSRLLQSYEADASGRTVIGRNTFVDFIGHDIGDIPAKVDTGADRSALWASNIEITDDHELCFVLFDKTSPYYTGEVVTTSDYSVSRVRSSSGHAQIRYRVNLPIRILGRRVRASFTLADRSRNVFPILIGRRTLAGKFLVDVAQAEFETEEKQKRQRLNDELKKDPLAFYKKYHASDNKDDKVET